MSELKDLKDDEVLVVELCDENHDPVTCQNVAVVRDRGAFDEYAKTEWLNARGDPVNGYELFGPDGEDLNFTLVATRWTLRERTNARTE